MAHYPHQIRLRGPWRGKGVETEGPVSGEVDLLLSQIQGPVILERNFGFPGRIDEEEQIWLTITNLPGLAKIRLNDHLLGENQTGSMEWEVKKRLKVRNHLSIEIHTRETGQGLVMVAIEIRRMIVPS